MKVSPLVQHVALEVHHDVPNDQAVVTSLKFDRPDAPVDWMRLYDVQPATIAAAPGLGVTVGNLHIYGFRVAVTGLQVSVETNAFLFKNVPQFAGWAPEQTRASDIANVLDGGKVWWGDDPVHSDEDFGLTFPDLTHTYSSPGTYDIRLEMWIRDLELFAHTYTMMATRQGIEVG